MTGGQAMQPDLIRRAEATDRTLREFRSKSFDWANGRHCGAMLFFHLRAMGRTKEKLPKFSSALGARAQLKRRGVKDVAELCGQWFKLEAIAPAAMLMGDVAVFDSEDGIGGVLICAGPHKYFGWREDEPRLVMLDIELHEIELAFRV